MLIIIVLLVSSQRSPVDQGLDCDIFGVSVGGALFFVCSSAADNQLTLYGQMYVDAQTLQL